MDEGSGAACSVIHINRRLHGPILPSGVCNSSDEAPPYPASGEASPCPRLLTPDS
jgi:hypothetical protein